MTTWPIALLIAAATAAGPGAKCPREIRAALASRGPCVSTARHSCLTQDMATEVATRFATPRGVGENARISRVQYSCKAQACRWQLDYAPTDPRAVVGSGFSIFVDDSTCEARLLPGL